ncbi:alpha/beta fold hydrolase [Amycolatopsis rhabdoformis]|uniref:Alpha/beta fold hydrolase n=1 Tax=Amycolatopsis rhabdoformis TaxID=1448059 RepID=A0ABZ1II36_9PSEU|nr:alpha/beta fold hydrolase [Amycolatopsis rhabdoformis]WSE34125.1 alpha/beta fold hydrolase [Amycolatopsis rhabdoformis]
MSFTEQGPEAETTIVLVHGLGGRRAQTAALADDLSRDSRVVSVDLLGHGSSPVGQGARGMVAQIEALQQLIEDLALTRVALVGHSAGGTTALRMTNEVQEIETVVLLDSSLIISDAVEDWADRLARSLDRDGFHQTVAGLLRANLGEAPEARIADEVNEAVKDTDPEVGAALLRDAVAFDATDEIRRSPSRICYVRSSRPLTAAQLHAVRPDVTFAHVQHAGHWVQMEQPRKVADIIRRTVFAPTSVPASQPGEA